MTDMHMSKQNTSSHQENKLFLSCSYTSREEFVREYRKFYYGKAEAKELYLILLNELKSTASVGDADSLKNLSTLIGYICIIENQSTLRTYYFDTNNPIKNTNLVILASKSNKVEILKCLFENRDILNNLSIDIGEHTILPDDEDGTCHNAFYYAIRSGNVELLDALINKWPDDYFATRLEELENVLSRSYEELKLKNVLLTDEIEIFVENKLIGLRFFSNNSGQVHSVKDDINNIKDRVTLVLENIRLLKKEYLNTNNVDEKFLFIAKFIAQNVHILKRQLKSTYDRLPWEEIEFCLVCFVSSHVKQHEINLFFHAALDKGKTLNHLENFSKRLQDEIIIQDIGISRLDVLPKLKREEVVTQIISNNPQFEELYNIYRQIRDAYSLEKISSYIELALLADPESKEGKLVITRSMQIIGEYLKNTLESPKLSSTTSEILLLSLSKNTREIISDLRDSLSHSYSLFKRTEIEESADVNYFGNFQNDMKKVGIVIRDILHNKKFEVVKALLEKISYSKDPDEIKETADILNNIRICDMTLKRGIRSQEEEKVEELIKELKHKMNNKTNYEKKLFDEIDNIMNSKKSRVISFKSDYMLESIDFMFGTKRIDSDGIKGIRTFVDDILANIKQQVVSNSLKDILKLIMNIYQSYMLREDDKHVNKLILKILCIAVSDSSNIKWIEELNSKLVAYKKSEKKKKVKDNELKSQNYQTILDQRLFTLKDILNKNGLSDQLVEKFSFYKSERKLQSAVEMLVLDIMSTLSSPGNHDLENNQLLLDDYSPLLTGKCLRNHLAHDNVLVDVLLFDPSIAIILNAEKLTTQNITTKKLGKLVRDVPSKLKDRYNHGLVTITNQDRMFITLEEGNLEGLKSCLQKGADINARRSTNLWTALHFAAKGSNLEVVKFIVNHTSNIDVKDIDNKNPLHIAACFGSSEIAKYFVEHKGMDVNCLDKYKRSPTLMAAQNGHKNVLEILLKNNADINIKDLNGFTSLHYAVKNNHRDIVMILLENENVDNNKTKDGLTPLHIACINNHLELVEFLLENKANVNAIAYNGWTPLHYTARSGNRNIAYVLIEKDPDINAKSTGQGDTPLHVAAEYGNSEIVEVLLNNDADINIKSIQNNDAPLHLASEGGYIDIVKTLLHEGADANAENKYNYTPLHFAALGNDNKELVEALIQAGANINAETKNGDTPLHLAARSGSERVVEVLVNMIVDINIKNGENRTPIELAVWRGHLQIVKTLLQHEKVNVNTKGNDDFTVLHIAAHAGNIEIVNCLVGKKADISAKTNQGDTPLHLAAGCGHKEVVEVLLENGAKVNSKSSEGITALHCAAESGFEKIIDILIENDGDVDAKEDVNNFTPLYVSALYGNLDCVKTLIDKEADVNAKSSYNITPLYAAALIGNKKIAETLIKEGAYINASDKNNFTPLHIAASEGHNNIVEVLSNNKADVNVKSSKDSTPIELAVLNDHLHVVQTLLRDSRVNINAKDNNGYTVLHIASQVGKLEIVKYLLDKGVGADINTKTCHGSTALHLAAANGYKDITKVLIAKGADTSIKDNQNRTAEEWESAFIYRNLYESDSSKIVNAHNNHDLKKKDLFEQILTIREKHYGPNHLKLAEVLISLGKTETNLGNYQKAKEFLERTLIIQDKHVSEKSEVAETLANLGNVYEKLGNPQKQKELLEQALSINEKHYGTDHLKVSTILVSLSIAYGNLGNPGKKRDLLERALPIQMKHNDSNEVEIARVYVNLGNTYGALGDIHKQKEFLEMALKMKTISSHFSKAFILNNLGSVCFHSGDIYRAKELFEQALLIKEKHFGSDHFELATTLVNLGTIYKDLGDNQKAKTFLENSLKIQETHYGPNNFKLVLTLTNLGIVYGDLGDCVKNIELCEKALSIAEGHYGCDNFEVAKPLANLGSAYGNLGNIQKAKELLQQALSIQEKHYGSDNFEIVATLVDLATSYNKLGKHQKEKKLLQRALEIQEKHGSNNFKLVRILMKLSVVHKYLGDLQKEKQLIERALEIQEKHDPENSVVAKILISLSMVYDSLGDLLKETQLLEKALDIQEKHDHEDLVTVHILQNLGATYGNLGNRQKAKMLLERALKVQERHYGPDHFELAATLENLCNTYGVLSDPETQKKLLERALSILKKNYGSYHPSVLKILRKMKEINLIINLDINEKSEILQHLQKRFNTATSSGDVQAVQRLLQEGADVSFKDADGRTPLHYAINNGHIGVVDILLKNGAVVTQITNKGNTPLHTAASKGYNEIVEVLLKHVSRDKLSDFIDAKTTSGSTTSLHVAAKNGFLDIVKSLMKHGATYNIENKEGKTPFDLSTDKNVSYMLKLVNEQFEGARNGNLEIIGKLKTVKSDEISAVTNVRNNQKCTLLQVAIISRHKKIACKLLEIIKEQERRKISK